jgi:hypothetical protein
MSAAVSAFRHARGFVRFCMVGDGAEEALNIPTQANIGLEWATRRVALPQAPQTFD